MSIAVTTVVRPSRILLMMVTAACLCVVSIAVLVGCNYFDVLSAWSRRLLVLVFAIAPILCWNLFFFSQKPYLITISAVGQIRILELASSVNDVREVFDASNSNWLVVKLLGDSTLWPKLLLLRLRSEEGCNIVLPILPDSVSLHSFRLLSIACRWIAVRVNRGDKETPCDSQS